MSDIGKILDKMNEYVKSGIGGKVIKSVPATKEEIKVWEDMTKETDKAFAILKAVLPEREKFWAKVNIRLDSFNQHLSYNREAKEIEFIEDSK